MLRKRQKESGQVAILFALVFTFMFVLFGFVVDIGHLINNKINLQIAADSAAYAGAAWQARTLNQIATINYRMRQDFKELAMRINVTHSRHNRRFPFSRADIDGPPTRVNSELMVCAQAHGYQSSSGLVFDNITNICANASPTTGGIPPILVPPVYATFDPFAFAIQAQIRAIQDASNAQCRSNAGENRRLVEHIINVYTNRSREHKKTIDALEGWLNEVKNETDLVDENSAKHPLTKTAFQSAFRNLALANKDEFRMEVIQPDGGNYLELQPVSIPTMAIPYYEFSSAGSGCVAIPKILGFPNMLAGVSKRREIITYFSVKLTSKPKMFFMPQNWVDNGEEFPILQAYATAKPFGSRIGPVGGVDKNMPSNSNGYPNFQFSVNDGLGIQNKKLLAYFNALHSFNSSGRTDGRRSSGWPEPSQQSDRLRQPLTAIKAATIFDAAFYTVFPNPDDSTIEEDYEEAQYAKDLFPEYMEAPSELNTLLPVRNSRTPAYFPTGNGIDSKGFIQAAVEVDRGFDAHFNGYAIEQPGSHSVTSPSRLLYTGGGRLNDVDGRLNQFGFATKEQIHSAWTPGDPKTKGRIGYSVKMIGMDLLRTLEIDLSSNGQKQRIANPLTNDQNAVSNVIH